MGDVAHDGHREMFEVFLMAANGERIEQALSGVFVSAVTAVDDADVRADLPGDEVRGTADVMAHDKHIALHGL